MSCKYCCSPYNHLECEIDEAELVKIVPLPAIDLTTGEKENQVESQYWAIRVLWHEEGYDVMEGFVPIKYCPMCGRKLEA